MSDRKNRVEGPERCIRTRGLAAAMSALSDFGPHASLESVAALAGCPKASLARVFSSKEALFLLAFAELDRIAMEALRLASARQGGGRAGALAAARASAAMASRPAFKGCPLNAASASLALCPWAATAVAKHKTNVVAFYAQELAADLEPARALLCAQAIAVILDGAHINASGGFGAGCADAAAEAIRAVIELASCE